MTDSPSAPSDPPASPAPPRPSRARSRTRNDRSSGAVGAAAIGLALGFLLLGILAGIGVSRVATPPPAGVGADTIFDDSGRPVQIVLPARRIVSFAPSVSEILTVAGCGPRIIAVDNNTDYPPDLVARNLPKVAGWKWVNYEFLESQKPDLVVVAGINAGDVPTLRSRGLNTFMLDAKDIFGVLQNVRIAGRLCGQTDHAVTTAAAFERRIYDVTDQTNWTEVRPRTYVEIGNDFVNPNLYYTFGPGTFGASLVTLAGANNVAGNLSTWPTVGTEFVVAANPEVIVITTSPWYAPTAADLAARTGWKDIAAITGNRVVSIDDNLVSRPGPRLVDGLEAAARAIHPELFK